ncbi:hypothetical protein ACWD62_35895 [Streptomyces sp. NPDC005146]
MHQILALLQHVSRLDRRLVTTAVAVVTTVAVVAAPIFWAPIERAELAVNLIAPCLAAAVSAIVAVVVERGKRHRR